MAGHGAISIPIEQLQVSIDNPRYDPQPDQRLALLRLTQDQGPKLVKLAEDILANGLNPSNNILVKRVKKDTYIVLDGNRRIAALKLMTQPALLQSLGLKASLESRFKKFNEDGGSNLPTHVQCAVLTDEEANHWIMLAHTGENEGRGTVPWDTAARHRFRGKTPALQAIEFV